MGSTEFRPALACFGVGPGPGTMFTLVGARQGAYSPQGSISAR